MIYRLIFRSILTFVNILFQIGIPVWATTSSCHCEFEGFRRL